MTEPLTIVGAGPVGSLLALLLARRGEQVRVFERRPDLRKHEQSAGRSINLAVSTRGLHALHEVGLDAEVLGSAVPMRGRMIHPVAGDLQFQAYGRDDSECINSMSRGGLNKLLMSQAEATGNVQIEFGQRLVDYSFKEKRATFQDELTCEVRALDAPVIFGTDGSASALRGALARECDAGVSEEFLDSGYKELTIPSAGGRGSGPGGNFSLEPGALHIWPRGSYMLIALPNIDGSFTCTLFLAASAPEGKPSFAALQSTEAVTRFFAEGFPDAAVLIPNLAAAFLAAPPGRMVTVKSQRWSQGCALLIGDAAHAIVPFFGQGMNAGFEDCTLLGGSLGVSPDWERVFSAFAEARRPDTDAIADLAIENYLEMRDKVSDPRFVLQKSVEAELQKRYPGEYLSRYQLVTFTRVPYRVALEAGRIQAQLLDEVTRGRIRASEVDYQLAHALVVERLLPLLRPHGYC